MYTFQMTPGVAHFLKHVCTKGGVWPQINRVKGCRKYMKSTTPNTTIYQHLFFKCRHYELLYTLLLYLWYCNRYLCTL